jgi:hypothetical protein
MSGAGLSADVGELDQEEGNTTVVTLDVVEGSTTMVVLDGVEGSTTVAMLDGLEGRTTYNRFNTYAWNRSIYSTT